MGWFIVLDGVRGPLEGPQCVAQAATGRRATLVELILAVLEVRGVAVDATSVARIRAKQALPTLERWATAAREVTQVSQLFKSDSARSA